MERRPLRKWSVLLLALALAGFASIVAAQSTGSTVMEQQMTPEEFRAAGLHKLSADELAAAADPQAVTDPAALNFAWSGKGDRKLLPARTYDDGTATFLAWPAGSPVPAILIKDSAGTEGPVNFTVRGDVIVVDGVPREIVLRSGKDNATLVNSGPVAPVAGVRQPTLARSDAQPSGENR